MRCQQIFDSIHAILPNKTQNSMYIIHHFSQLQQSYRKTTYTLSELIFAVACKMENKATFLIKPIRLGNKTKT